MKIFRYQHDNKIIFKLKIIIISMKMNIFLVKYVQAIKLQIIIVD